MMYDFETVPDRQGTGSLKWRKYEGTEVQPMWVADMDFLSPPEVIAALEERVAHGVFGYTVPTAAAETAALGYLARRHGVQAGAQELVWLPGLVQGLNLVCRAAGAAGDAVMVNTPVYPPFLSAPIFSERKRITSPLIEVDGVWTFDRDGMERAVTPETRLFILCNPHNPVGRVFSRDDLTWLLDFCERHDLWICSDEIHCDLLLDDVEHVPMLSLGERAAQRTITFLSASKTYNLPGLACAYAVIPNEEIRNAFKRVCRGIITEVNCFGYTGCAAAYTHGEPWRQAVCDVLRGNRDLIRESLQLHSPDVRMPRTEATYLAWLDVRAYDLENPVAHFEAHGLGLSNGMDFGAEKGFVRLNFGCPRHVLVSGLARFQAALAAARR